LKNDIYTIGHSNHELEYLMGLLAQHHISAVADVRSSPYSRINPQFNREGFANSLKKSGIEYVFLGKELGARTDDESCYDDDQVIFSRLAQTEPFERGLKRVIDGSHRYRLAMLCAEKDPLDCHRTILNAHVLTELGFSVKHILAGGKIETHEMSMERLMRDLDMAEDDLFSNHEDLLGDAIEFQSKKIGYRKTR